jgi:N-alpha-acetyltransferase 10/11
MRGHITSLATLKKYRKMGIASKLMQAAHRAMKAIMEAEDVALHVRITNKAATALYKDKFEYE